MKRTILAAGLALTLGAGTATAQPPVSPNLSGNYAFDLFDHPGTDGTPTFQGGMTIAQNRRTKLAGEFGLTDHLQGTLKGRMRPEGELATFALTLRVKQPRFGTPCRLVLVGAWAPPAEPGDVIISGVYSVRACRGLNGSGHFLGIGE